MGAKHAAVLAPFCCTSNDANGNGKHVGDAMTEAKDLKEHSMSTTARDEEEEGAFFRSPSLRMTSTLSANSASSMESQASRLLEGDSEVDDTLGHARRGVTVHHLKKSLPADILKAGCTCNDTIYRIERDVIRAKGVDTVCPRDGDPGAAYVDCISGPRHAGLAQFMLSYTWGYKVQDIIDTLQEFCRRKGLSKSNAYIWICCLCINQHRVKASRSSVPFHEFRDMFKSRVIGIGKVIAMVLPWRDPTYIKRAWCIFELFTAVTEELELELAMPERESTNFLESLKGGVGIDEMWTALNGLDVRQAAAYTRIDRENIMQTIEHGVGFKELNAIVSSCLVKWVLRTAETHIERLCSDDSLDAYSKATSCLHVARLHYMVGHLGNAESTYATGIELCQADGILGTTIGAQLLIGIGQVEHEKGNSMKQLRYNEKAKDILMEIGKLCTNEGAHLLCSMATYLKDEVGDLNKAHDFYKQAKEIREIRGTSESHDGAWIEWGIADVARKQGDLGYALQGFNDARMLLESIDSLETPCGAWTAFSIAHIKLEIGEMDDAYEGFLEAKSIREKNGNLDSMDGALILLGLAETQRQLQNYEDALDWLQAIEEMANTRDMCQHQYVSVLLGNRTITDLKRQIEDRLVRHQSEFSESVPVSATSTLRSKRGKFKAKSISFVSELTKQFSQATLAYSLSSSTGSYSPRHVA